MESLFVLQKIPVHDHFAIEQEVDGEREFILTDKSSKKVGTYSSLKKCVLLAKAIKFAGDAVACLAPDEKSSAVFALSEALEQQAESSDEE